MEGRASSPGPLDSQRFYLTFQLTRETDLSRFGLDVGREGNFSLTIPFPEQESQHHPNIEFKSVDIYTL